MLNSKSINITKEISLFMRVRFHLGGLKMPLWSLEDAFEAPQCYPGANVGSQNKCCCGWGRVKILLQNHASRCRGVSKKNETPLVFFAWFCKQVFDFSPATATLFLGTRRFQRNYQKWNVPRTIGSEHIMLKTDAPVAIPEGSIATLTNILQTF